MRSGAAVALAICLILLAVATVDAKRRYNSQVPQIPNDLADRYVLGDLSGDGIDDFVIWKPDTPNLFVTRTSFKSEGYAHWYAGDNTEIKRVFTGWFRTKDNKAKGWAKERVCAEVESNSQKTIDCLVMDDTNTKLEPEGSQLSFLNDDEIIVGNFEGNGHLSDDLLLYNKAAGTLRFYGYDDTTKQFVAIAAEAGALDSTNAGAEPKDLAALKDKRIIAGQFSDFDYVYGGCTAKSTKGTCINVDQLKCSTEVEDGCGSDSKSKRCTGKLENKNEFLGSHDDLLVIDPTTRDIAIFIIGHKGTAGQTGFALTFYKKFEASAFYAQGAVLHAANVHGDIWDALVSHDPTTGEIKIFNVEQEGHDVVEENGIDTTLVTHANSHLAWVDIDETPKGTKTQPFQQKDDAIFFFPADKEYHVISADRRPKPQGALTSVKPTWANFHSRYRQKVVILGDDQDGDGLINFYELGGKRSVPLHHYGASPFVKDLFVEVDYMVRPGVIKRSFAMTKKAIGVAVAAMAEHGINLHILQENNAQITQHQEYLGTKGVDADMPALIDHIRQAHFTPEREELFRYCVMADRYYDGSESGSSGMAELPGSSFVVTLGSFPSVDTNTLAGTFLHEMGHTLGLSHGSTDHENYKPHHLSIMNYAFQFGGFVRKENGKTKRVMHYSEVECNAINENAFDETKGFVCKGTGLDRYRTCIQSFVGQKVSQGVLPRCGFELNKPVKTSTNPLAKPKTSVAYDLNGDGQKTWLERTVDEYKRMMFTMGARTSRMSGTPADDTFVELSKRLHHHRRTEPAENAPAEQPEGGDEAAAPQTAASAEEEAQDNLEAADQAETAEENAQETEASKEDAAEDLKKASNHDHATYEMYQKLPDELKTPMTPEEEAPFDHPNPIHQVIDSEFIAEAAPEGKHTFMLPIEEEREDYLEQAFAKFTGEAFVPARREFTSVDDTILAGPDLIDRTKDAAPAEAESIALLQQHSSAAEHKRATHHQQQRTELQRNAELAALIRKHGWRVLLTPAERVRQRELRQRQLLEEERASRRD